MSLAPVLSIAKFLVNIPAWVVVGYLCVAGAMTICLLIQFLRNTRTRNAKKNAWLVLFILMFPLAALSMVWPITLPFAIGVLWKDHKQSRVRRGFPVAKQAMAACQRCGGKLRNGSARYCARCGTEVPQMQQLPTLEN